MPGMTRTAEDDAVVRGISDNPYGFLGRHTATLNGRPAVSIRTLQPGAADVQLLLRDGTEVSMQRRHRDGLFEATIPAEGRELHDIDYRLRVTEPGGFVREIDDPFKYGQVLSE